MKSIVSILLFCIVSFAAIGQNAQPPKTLPGGWVYIWGDEFNGATLDKKKWKYEMGVVRNPDSFQTYTDRKKNVRVERGCLVLEAHKETFPNINYKKDGKGWVDGTKDRPFTSGSVTTRGLYYLHFGRLEIRAKIPRVKGVWPAVWTMHENKWGWPANGEIDILEHVSQDTNICHTVFRWGVDGGRKEALVQKQTRIPSYADDFHIYVFEWDKDMMRVEIDGKEIGRINVSDADYPDGAGNPLRTPCYLIMNMALGGNWCEHPDADGKGYPCKFLIDYIRYYQKKEHAEDAKKYDPRTGLLKDSPSGGAPERGAGKRTAG